jgi:GNAT superfamily N-acetyltransferase
LSYGAVRRLSTVEPGRSVTARYAPPDRLDSRFTEGLAADSPAGCEVYDSDRRPDPRLSAIGPLQPFRASGYRILGEGRGKTTLLAVVPEYLRSGIGAALQEPRLQAMAALGVHTVTTNAARPETIRWYKSRYGYREVGRLQKIHSFGHPDIDHSTTLELDLTDYLWKTSLKGPTGD